MAKSTAALSPADGAALPCPAIRRTDGRRAAGQAGAPATVPAVDGLVERASAVTLLDRLLADAAAGRGAVALLAGRAGAGRTALLQAFTARAARAGATVLEAFGSSAERDVPLGVLHQLSAGARPALAGEEHFLAGGGEPRPRLLLELWNALRGRAEDGPVVLAVDDVHLADAASQHGLAHLGRRLGTAGVLLVLTEWDDSAGEGGRAGWRTDLLRQPACHRVAVPPLSDRAAGALLTPLLGAASAAAAPRAVELTGGNPLLLRSLAEDLRAAGFPAGPPVPGAAYGDAVLACLRRSGDPAGRLARALAVLETTGSAGKLRRLLAGDPATAGVPVGRTLELLEETGVLLAGRFRHGAGRAAVLADLSEDGDARAALHRRVADLLYRTGSAAEEVAVHLVAAGEAPAEWGVDVLCAAAEPALGRDDLPFASACLRLAERAAHGEHQRAAVALHRARIEWRANPGAALRHIEPLVPALAEGRIAGEQAITMIKLLLWHGAEDAAVGGLAALERRRPELDARTRNGLDMIRTYLAANHPPLAAALPRLVAAGPPVPPEQAGRGVAATVIEGPVIQAVGTLTEVLRGGGSDRVVRSAEAVLEATPLDDELLGSLEWALLTLVYAERAELAAGWCDRLLLAASTRRAPTWQAMLSGVRAEIAMAQGDPATARRHAETALTRIPAWAWGVGVGRPLAALLRATTATGGADDALLATPVPDSIFHTRFGLQYLYARGQRRRARGLPHAALDDLLTCGRLATEWAIDLPTFVPWRSEAALALIALGRRDEARALAEEQLARPSGGRARGVGLRVLAACSDVRERPALLRSAVDLLGEAGDRLELATALADLAAEHRRIGEIAKARMIARRADLLAAGCGAEPLRARLRAAGSDEPPATAETAETAPPAATGLAPGAAAAPPDEAAAAHAHGRHGRHGRAGTHRTAGTYGPVGPAAGQEPLSASELQVAMLAMSGRTNREIAKKLYITVSTVEQHLTRAYRKLRVNGRADLPLGLHV